MAYSVVTPRGLDIYLFTIKRIKELIANDDYHATITGGDIGSNTRMYVFKLADVAPFAKKIEENL